MAEVVVFNVSSTDTSFMDTAEYYYMQQHWNVGVTCTVEVTGHF